MKPWLLLALLAHCAAALGGVDPDVPLVYQVGDNPALPQAVRVQPAAPVDGPKLAKPKVEPVRLEALAGLAGLGPVRPSLTRPAAAPALPKLPPLGVTPPSGATLPLGPVVPAPAPLPPTVVVPPPGPPVEVPGFVPHVLPPLRLAQSVPLPEGPPDLAVAQAPSAPALPGGVAPAQALLATRLHAGPADAALRADLARASDAELLALLAGCSLRWEDEAAADALVGLLLERGALAPERHASLPRPLALHLGCHLARRGDERCLALFEGLLAGYWEPEERDLPELAGLAVYWRRKGEPAKAAQTLLRARDYSTSPAVLSNNAVEAARCYVLADDEAAAERVYASVANYGYGWATGLAIYDRAQRLLQAERYDEARELLAQPVAGAYAEQIEVALEYLRGCLAVRCNQLDEAVARLKHVVALATQVRMLPQEGLESVVQQAHHLVRAISSAQTQPIWCTAPEVSLDRQGDVYAATLPVQAMSPMVFSATAEDGRLECLLVTPWHRRGLLYECSVRVATCGGATIRGGLRATILAHDGSAQPVRLATVTVVPRATTREGS